MIKKLNLSKIDGIITDAKATIPISEAMSEIFSIWSLVKCKETTIINVCKFNVIVNGLLVLSGVEA